MSNTPEGKVKDKIDRVLQKYEPEIWAHKPVQNGMGKPCLDYHFCYHSLYGAIEAKAPGEKLTARQEMTAAAILAAGGVVFVIDDDDGIARLKHWLDEN